MSGYGRFSHFYPLLMGQVDYEQRADYLASVFRRYGQQPGCLLDIGCGTGRMTRLLAAKGYEMVGIDASAEMLSLAREQTPAQTEILWICQDIRELDLYGTAQGGVSTFDCLNHLTGDGDLKDFFGRLRYFLEPGNLFVFDVNTPYKHQTLLGDHTFVYDTPEVYCVWQNQTDRETLATTMTLDLFVPRESGYERFTEQVKERGYTRSQIERAAAPWFSVVDVFHDMTFDPPQEDSERVIYVMKKQ